MYLPVDGQYYYKVALHFVDDTRNDMWMMNLSSADGVKDEYEVLYLMIMFN